MFELWYVCKQLVIRKLTITENVLLIETNQNLRLVSYICRLMYLKRNGRFACGIRARLFNLALCPELSEDW